MKVDGIGAMFLGGVASASDALSHDLDSR
jgi:hypothetical protein